MIRIDAVENAEISKDFGPGKLKLRPLIYSHGNKGLPAGYAANLSDFASRGMVVFAPAHTDKSCRYTELQDGTPIMGEADMDNADLDRWEEKMLVRVEDIKSVYTDITTEKNELFDMIDRDNVYLAGHSAGGCSAFLAGQELGKDKIKAVATFDGANVIHPNGLDSEVPLLSVSTKDFAPFYNKMVNDKVDLEEERDKIHSGCSSEHNVRYISDAHGHLDFDDTPLVNPLICRAFHGHWPCEDISQHLLVSNGLFLRFIN
jgi:dienelactone hydrolase